MTTRCADAARPRQAEGDGSGRAEAARPGSARGRLGGQHGFVAGAEALLFGVLIFLGGTITALNAWAVVDAKMSVTAAAREAARAAVDAPDGTSGGALTAIAHQAARDALAAQRKDPAEMVGSPEVVGTIGRCQPVRVEVAYGVRGIRVPWLGAFGSRTIVVSGVASEIVDPFRSGLAGEADRGTCGF